MARRYKIKKRYGLKGLADGWHVYSRNIVLGKGKGLSFKRRRVCGPFVSRKAAARAVRGLERKSRIFAKVLVRVRA
jgi:hypothetical protein